MLTCPPASAAGTEKQVLGLRTRTPKASHTGKGSFGLMTSFPERQVPSATPILRGARSGCPGPATLGAVGARPAPGSARGAAHLRSEGPREGTASAPRPRRERPCCPRAAPAPLAGPGRAPAGAARAPGRLASSVALARGSGRGAGACRAGGPLPEDRRRATPARPGEGRGARTQDGDSGLPGGTGQVAELGCSRLRAASPMTQPWLCECPNSPRKARSLYRRVQPTQLERTGNFPIGTAKSSAGAARGCGDAVPRL